MTSEPSMIEEAIRAHAESRSPKTYQLGELEALDVSFDPAPCRPGSHRGARTFAFADQTMGREQWRCQCGSHVLGAPLHWVSPWEEDYIPGHELNTWRAF